MLLQNAVTLSTKVARDNRQQPNKRRNDDSMQKIMMMMMAMEAVTSFNYSL
jgi:hypothetical protein